MRRRPCARWLKVVGVVGTLIGLAWSRAARAEVQPQTVIFTLDANSEAQKQAITAIQAHVSGLPLEIVVLPMERERSLDRRLAASEALATSRHALGTFSLEVAADGSLLIFFTEAAGEATLIRRLRPNQQGARVALEQAAIVVRSLIEALLDGGSIGIATPRADPDEPDAPPRPPRDREPARGLPDEVGVARSNIPSADSGSAREATATARSRSVAISTGATLTQFAAGAPWHAGLSVGGQWLMRPELYAAAHYSVFPSMTVSGEGATALLERHPLDVRVGYRSIGAVAVGAEIGVQIDRVTRSTLRTAPGFRPTADDARWLLAVGGSGGLSWSPWSPLTGSLRLGADFLLTPYSYAIDPGSNAVGAEDPIPSPRSVRPRVELELAFWLW